MRWNYYACARREQYLAGRLVWIYTRCGAWEISTNRTRFRAYTDDAERLMWRRHQLSHNASPYVARFTRRELLESVTMPPKPTPARRAEPIGTYYDSPDTYIPVHGADGYYAPNNERPFFRGDDDMGSDGYPWTYADESRALVRDAINEYKYCPETEW